LRGKQVEQTLVSALEIASGGGIVGYINGRLAERVCVCAQLFQSKTKQTFSSRETNSSRPNARREGPTTSGNPQFLH